MARLSARSLRPAPLAHGHRATEEEIVGQSRPTIGHGVQTTMLRHHRNARVRVWMWTLLWFWCAWGIAAAAQAQEGSPEEGAPEIEASEKDEPGAEAPEQDASNHDASDQDANPDPVRIRLVLRDGSMIESRLFRETPDHVLVTLGGQETSVPTASILQRFHLSDTTKQGVYFEADRNAKTRALPDLVLLTEEAIVLVGQKNGLGTGFIIHPDGYVITNQHVVNDSNQLALTLFRKTEKGVVQEVHKNVRILAMSAAYDIALLKIETETPRKFSFLRIGDSRRLFHGEKVFTFGHPHGLKHSAAEGIIAQAVPRAVEPRPNVGEGIYLQTTAPINPGNSGGPLLNMRGEVVGITNMKVAYSDGLGFAIPSVNLKLFLDYRESFAFSPINPNNGFRYFAPPTATHEGPPAQAPNAGVK